MTNAAALLRADGRRDARLAWVTGGSLLVAYAALPLLLRGLPFSGLSIVVDSLWAVSLLLFAFGIRGSGSVVARRAGGVAALVVAAAAPLATMWAMQLAVPVTAPFDGPHPLPPNLPAAIPFDAVASDTTWTVVSVIGQVGSLLLLVAPLLAAFMIGRVGALPRRVRWLPLIAVACGPAVGLLAQLIDAAESSQNLDAIIWVFQAGSALSTLGYLLLGILASAFAPRASVLLGETEASPLDAASEPQVAQGERSD